MKYNTIVFCDFDGTVTEEETLTGFLRLTVPEHAAKIEGEIRSGQKTLSQSIRDCFARVPSRELPRLYDYISSVKIRPGLEELLDFLGNMHIPFVLLSGGLPQMIEASLGHLKEKMFGFHSSDLDVSGPFMNISSLWDDGNEIVAKAKVMETYDYNQAVCIGDGYTDMNMAKKSDIVFARDFLAKIMETEGKPYFPWNDFFDIINSWEKAVVSPSKLR